MKKSNASLKVYYVANARMPTEKAHGIQIAKMCEAFIESGIDLELVIPSRSTVPDSIKDFYKLRVSVPVRRLSVPDFYARGRVGYTVSSLLFMVAATLYLMQKKKRGERFVTYTVDLDNFSSTTLGFSRTLFFTEMHGGKPNTIFQRFLFKNLSGVIPINSHIKNELRSKFSRSKARYFVEPNGVDADMFVAYEKEEMRKELGVPLEEKIVLYAGRFFAWKGLESIVEAAQNSIHSSVLWYVLGGTKDEFEHIVGMKVPDNIIFPGAVAYSDIPKWLAIADALLVLGTKRDTQSYFYTSPMKLFEYLLAKRPIIASRTPAIESVVTEKEVVFYEPDNTKSLAEQAIAVTTHPEQYENRTQEAESLGRRYSWKGRAERILDFITDIYGSSA